MKKMFPSSDSLLSAINNMYAKILPIRKLPKSLDYFDYKVPSFMEPLINIGQVVLIPFRKQKVKGLVLSLKKTSSYKKVREVAEIIEVEPVITERQMKLARFVSDYYLVSMATVLKQISPPILKRPRVQKASLPPKASPKIKSDYPKAILEAADKIIKSKKNKFLLHYLDQKDKFSLYLKLIDYYTSKNKQVLILFPEIIDIEIFQKKLASKFHKYISVINHSLSKSELSHNFQRIRKNKARIILGTPLAVFSPLSNPGIILIDQEESQNHKQYDQNPRFNDKTVAYELLKLTRAKLLLASVAPNIETYFKAFKGELELIEILPLLKKNVRIVNLKSEAKSSHFATISRALKKEIEAVLSKKGRVLLFLNRKGFSRSIICQDCGHTLLCPNCQVPFTLQKENNSSYHFCYRCGLKKDLILKCPACQGSNFRDLGLGTEKVEKEAKMLFENHKIGRFEGQIKDGQKLDNYEIVISTHLTFKRINWKNISLIGVISADTLLHLPDFRSQEKTYQILTRILSYSLEAKNNKLIIQTYSPRNATLKFFPFRYLSFFRSELKIRKEFSYPPFTKLIKLVSMSPKKDEALKEAEIIYKKLQPLPSSPPLPAFIFKRFALYRYQLILKVPHKKRREIKSRLKKVIPDNWIIDIDPENLL